MTSKMLTLQSLREGRWQDFATGEEARCIEHIANNAPGFWRAVNVMGTPVLGPRDVEQYIEANGHLHLPAPVIGVKEGVPIYGQARHSPDCPCVAGPVR